MVAIREYIDSAGRSSFGRWFAGLDVQAAAKVTIALERIAAGHTAAMKSVGLGVSEYRIDFGPGYRIYFGRHGDELLILLGGGSKKRQQADIEAAQAARKDYKARRRTES